METKRLKMRPFKASDVDEFAPICADENVMRYIGSGTHNKEETKKRVKEVMDKYEKDGFGLMALIDKEDDRFIGFCGLIRQVVDGVSYIELGYRLGYEYWGKGLATEAAIAIRDYAFEQLKLKELISIIHEDNKASEKVANKVGMKLFKKTIYKGLNVLVYRIEIP